MIATTHRIDPSANNKPRSTKETVSDPATAHGTRHTVERDERARQVEQWTSNTERTVR